MLNKSLKLFLRTKSGEVQDMRTVILAGLALGAAALSVPATAAGESAGTSARGHMTGVQYAPPPARPTATYRTRSEEHTSELQSLMRISYAVFCLKKKNTNTTHNLIVQQTN